MVTFRGSEAVFCPPQAPTHHKLNETNNNGKKPTSVVGYGVTFLQHQNSSLKGCEIIVLSWESGGFPYSILLVTWGRHTFLPTPHVHRTCRSVLGSKGGRSQGLLRLKLVTVSTLSCTIINRKLCCNVKPCLWNQSLPTWLIVFVLIHLLNSNDRPSSVFKLCSYFPNDALFILK